MKFSTLALASAFLVLMTVGVNADDLAFEPMTTPQPQAEENRQEELPETLPEETLLQLEPLPSGPGGGGGGGGGTGGGGGYVCSASITCPGTQWFPAYTLTCQGRYSCSSTANAVICDGYGTLCFG